MADIGDRPVPLINPAQCNGCALCMRVCPTSALELQAGKAVVAHPSRCEYHGYCEAICPVNAIFRPFEILIADADAGADEEGPNSTKVVEDQ